MNCGVEWGGPRRKREREERGCNWSNFCCAVPVRYRTTICAPMPMSERLEWREEGRRLEGGMEGDGLLGETLQYRDRE